jgi:hypothetical protein
MTKQTQGGQTTSYTLDLVSGRRQILSDGTTTYLYGNARLGQQSSGEMEFFLADALGSVRQLANDTLITLSKARTLVEPLTRMSIHTL